MLTSNDRQRTEREATRRWLAGLLAQRQLGFLNRLAARVEGRLGRWQAHWATLSRRGRRALARRLAPALLGASLLAGLAVATQPAAATSIVVDEVTCTLVEAINSANTDTAVGDCAAGNGDDVIVLQADVSLTTSLGVMTYSHTGLPAVTTTITVEGNGHTIERATGSPKFRLLWVATSGNLTLNDVTLKGGYAYYDSSVFNYIYGTGGAVDNDGRLTITNSVISGNTARQSGGGIMNWDAELLSLTNTVVTQNEAKGFSGGGVSITRATATITDSSISDNYCYCSGGGIDLLQNGIVNITGSTINGNRSARGGGVFIDNGSELTLVNSTISGNEATHYGGGIENQGDGTLTLTNSTVTANTAGYLGSLGGGLFLRAYSRTTLERSIVSGNDALTGAEIHAANNGYAYIYAGADNLFGHSGLSNAQAFNVFTPGGSDLTATGDGGQPTPLAAILSPLADNGGPTLTHALPPGSPAIDLAVSGPAADQRGKPRPFGAGFDAGAYEAQPPDDDDDGIPDAIEDGAPNGGDGDNDGTPDSEQAHVASLPDSQSGDYVTLAAPAGTDLVDVQAIDNPAPGDAPAGVTFPIGFLDFEVRGVTPGGAVVVTLFLHGGQTVDTYYKYGPTPDNPANHWYQFHNNGTTGAAFPGDRILLHLVDGGRGDSDVTANGVIIDPGAPGHGAPAAPALYVSGSSGSVGAINFDNRDILAFDTVAQSWAMHFDGSDVGVTKKLSAFSILPDGSIVMSFHARQSVLPGLAGDALPHDLVRFVPASLGDTTAGVFEWYVDGSDVGLTATSERIDALDILADGRVLISSSGTLAVPGPLSAQNEDLIALTPTSLGSTTAGAWALYFDGTAIAGLPKEDVSGAHVDEAGGDLYLVIDGGFKINGWRGNSKDVLKLSPAGGGYVATRFWSGPEHGFNGKISGLELE